MSESQHSKALAESYGQFVDSASAILREETTFEGTKLEISFSRFAEEARALISGEVGSSEAETQQGFLSFIAAAKEDLAREEQTELEKCSQSLADMRAALEDDVEAKIDWLRKMLAQYGMSHEGVNVFSILRMERQEDPQSYFLAWLLDPEGTHGLGDAVLRQFLKRACSLVGDCAFNSLNIENVRVTPQQPIEDVGVPDVEIVGQNFICVVENKVLAGETLKEGIPQTKRYSEYYRKMTTEAGQYLILLYLVPKESKKPASGDFGQILYDDIVDIVKSATENTHPIPEVKCLIDMFVYNVEKEICHRFDDYFEARDLLGQPRDYFLRPDGYYRLVRATESLGRETRSG